MNPTWRLSALLPFPCLQMPWPIMFVHRHSPELPQTTSRFQLCGVWCPEISLTAKIWSDYLCNSRISREPYRHFPAGMFSVPRLAWVCNPLFSISTMMMARIMLNLLKVNATSDSDTHTDIAEVPGLPRNFTCIELDTFWSSDSEHPKTTSISSHVWRWLVLAPTFGMVCA